MLLFLVCFGSELKDSDLWRGILEDSWLALGPNIDLGEGTLGGIDRLISPLPLWCLTGLLDGVFLVMRTQGLCVSLRLNFVPCFVFQFTCPQNVQEGLIPSSQIWYLLLAVTLGLCLDPQYFPKLDP